ncbi:MAG: ABC transporter ATP-binding protein [Clostridiales bacterium]|nr:ABC transporter ATP-binding protein [Clostridiales bacterium]
MLDCVLRTEKIRKSFGGVRAIEDFSMELFSGETRGIIGPNGAGKTTIYNCISGIYKLDSGEITLGGTRTTAMAQEEIARLGLSRTFQNTRLFPGLSVLDNVKVAVDWTGKYTMLQAMLRTPKVRREERRIQEEAMRCLKTARLDGYAKMRPQNLSYGIQRRLEIARALASSPKVLMLDEPAAGLNPEEVSQLIDFIAEIRENFHLSLLIIEHKMDVIMQLCSRIYVQDSGVTIAEGCASEIQANPVVLAAYLGEAKKA